MEIFKSRLKDDDNTYRAIALIRYGFGGHHFGKEEYVAKDIETSRIGRI